jgi:hypothetical protein
MRTIFKYIGYFLATASAVVIIRTWAVSDYRARTERRTIIRNDSIQNVMLKNVLINQNEMWMWQYDNSVTLDVLDKSWQNFLKRDSKFDLLLDYNQKLLDALKKNENNLHPLVPKQIPDSLKWGYNKMK